MRIAWDTCLYSGGEIRFIDHLWQIFPKEQQPFHEIGKTKRLDRVGGIGDVVQYQRRNGTHDFAIQVFDASPILITAPGKQASARFSYLQQCIEALDQQTAYISVDVDIEAVRIRLVAALERLEQQMNACLYYSYLSVTQKGKPKPHLDILPFGKRRRRG
ncbi:MAG TPA: hypothetical protein V6C65_09440 [Allocoleopsis sp.]